MANARWRLPAEWEPQDGVLLAWPHEGTDWAARLAEVEGSYVALVRAIAGFEPAVVCVADATIEERARRRLVAAGTPIERVRFVRVEYDDTWLRDSGPITLVAGARRRLLDFRFTGWGGKFGAERDDLLVENLAAQGLFGASERRRIDFALEGGAIDADGAGTLLTTWRCLHQRHPQLSRGELRETLARELCASRVLMLERGWLEGDDTDAQVFTTQARETIDFALEGGAIETDGDGTLLTTWRCLHERHPDASREELTGKLAGWLQQDRVLWLDHGALEGDDTDAHIDTLARFAGGAHIVHQHCDTAGDVHFEELRAMAAELAGFVQADGRPYRLTALPWARPIRAADGRRLAASYANFLVINGAVLMPAYGDPADGHARALLARAFAGREVVPVPCRPLIEQNGSLHCVTMQLPRGVLHAGTA